MSKKIKLLGLERSLTLLQVLSSAQERMMQFAGMVNKDFSEKTISEDIKKETLDKIEVKFNRNSKVISELESHCRTLVKNQLGGIVTTDFCLDPLERGYSLEFQAYAEKAKKAKDELSANMEKITGGESAPIKKV